MSELPVRYTEDRNAEWKIINNVVQVENYENFNFVTLTESDLTQMINALRETQNDS